MDLKDMDPKDMDPKDMDPRAIMIRMGNKATVLRDILTRMGKDKVKAKGKAKGILTHIVKGSSNSNKASPQIVHSRKDPPLVNRGSLLRSLQTLRSQEYLGQLI